MKSGNIFLKSLIRWKLWQLLPVITELSLLSFLSFRNQYSMKDVSIFILLKNSNKKFSLNLYQLHFLLYKKCLEIEFYPVAPRPHMFRSFLIHFCIVLFERGCTNGFFWHLALYARFFSYPIVELTVDPTKKNL